MGGTGWDDGSCVGRSGMVMRWPGGAVNGQWMVCQCCVNIAFLALACEMWAL